MNKLFVFVSFFIFSSFHSFSQTPVGWLWGENYNGSVKSSVYLNNYLYVIGNYYSAPTQIGSVTLSNSGGFDMYIAKWDTLGNLIWAKSISDTGSQTAISVRANSNNEIVVAGNNSNPSLVIGNDTITSGVNSGAFIAKYDVNGNVLDAYGLASEYVNDICIDNSNNIYAATYDGLFKVDNGGSVLWQKPFIISQLEFSSISSSLMLVGSFEGTLTMGGFTIVSAYSATWGPTNDIFAAEVNLNGDVNWLTNLSNTIRSDYIGNNYLQESTGKLFVPIKTFSLGGQYVSLHSVSPTGIDGILPISNTAPGVIIASLSSSDYPDIPNISGKDSLLSFMLGNSNYMSSVVRSLCVFNLNTHLTIQSYDCESDYHLFRGFNSIYMSGIVTMGNVSNTFGKLNLSVMSNPNSHLFMNKCVGTVTNLSSGVIGGMPPLTYSWSPSIGLSSTTNSTTSFVATSNISYTLTVTDVNSQVMKDTFDITVDTPLSAISITPQYPAYCHDTMSLYTTPAVTVMWLKFDGTNWVPNYLLPYDDTTIITGPGLYGASYGNSCGSVFDSIQIQSVVNVTANASLSDICIGQSTVLSGSGALTYTWSGGVFDNTSFNPTTTQTYIVSGTDINGCMDTASISVGVHPFPSIASITASPATTCTGDSSTLTMNQSIVYCTPTVLYSGATGQYIANVTLGSGLINNTTGDGPGDYNYYNATNANVIAGMSYPISISRNTGVSAASSRTVWIDYNQDGIFDDMNEKVLAIDTSAITFSGMITIPTSALNGTTRMRIAGRFFGISTSCDINYYGEFEDYNLTISGGVNNIQWTPSTFLNSVYGSQVQATNVSATTTYGVTVTSSYGCSTSGTVTLNVNPANSSTINTTICASALPYIWNAQSITSTGTYTANFTNSYGCDSIEILNLTVNPIGTSTTNASICSSALPYIWNTLSLTTSGTYTSTFTNSVGCDSTATLNLTVNPISTSTTNVSICAATLPYVWNTLSLTASGTYTSTFTNALGCDSIAILNLTVNSASVSTTNTTICSSSLPYVWNGQSFTSSGTYTSTFIGASGCDSTSTLNLVVNPTPQPLIIQNNYTLTCTNASNVSYQWYLNGTAIGISDSVLNINQDGQYIIKITDSVGCIGYDTLNVIGLGVRGNSIQTGVSVYPNPTMNQIIIEYELVDPTSYELKLFDVSGQLVWSTTITEEFSGKHIQSINLKDYGLKDGVYLLTGQTDLQHWTKRIVLIN